MSVKPPKQILIQCLIASLLISTLGCMSLLQSVDPKRNSEGLPIKDLELTMDVSQRKDYFNQLHKFADKHTLRYESYSENSDNKSFIIAMYGDGFHITSSNVSTSSRIALSFFSEKPGSISPESVEKLWADLKNVINEIPNVTITEGK